jgi:uncharacterized small protein (DUF1192 family)
MSKFGGTPEIDAAANSIAEHEDRVRELNEEIEQLRNMLSDKYDGEGAMKELT